MSSIIAINNLWFKYGDETALQDVTLHIDQGECIGIFGPNGGGKTTLLKLLLGLLKPWKGDIRVYGETPPVADMAYVPQNFSFDRRFPITSLEVVLGGLARHRASNQIKNKQAKHALETVGMIEFASKQFGSLSGGQMQRVLVARALVSEPKILLLDEPTSCTDKKGETDLFAILSSLKPKTTIIIVTHHIDAIAPLVTRMACVHRTATIMNPQEICDHFAFGLYHPPELEKT